jgi:transposase
MSENATQHKALATIWRTPDELWEKIEPILALHTTRQRARVEHGSSPPQPASRPGCHYPFRMRSGVQWNHLPTEEFPDDSSVHRTFQRWIEKGVLDLIWERLIGECEELGGVDFEWRAAEGAMGKKARFGGIS